MEKIRCSSVFESNGKREKKVHLRLNIRGFKSRVGYNGASTASTYAVRKLKIFPSLRLKKETKTYS